MAIVKVTCKIKDYSEPVRKGDLKIHSHYNSRLVILEIDGNRYTVGGDDLKRAVDNCMNTGF